MVFYTLPWSLELVKQGIGRMWRQGQRNKVFVHSLIVVETEDERVFDVVQEKSGVHDRVMKGLL
jgi:SNF2 family DNA or RNA helicase